MAVSLAAGDGADLHAHGQAGLGGRRADDVAGPDQALVPEAGLDPQDPHLAGAGSDEQEFLVFRKGSWLCERRIRLD